MDLYKTKSPFNVCFIEYMRTVSRENYKNVTCVTKLDILS